jgi:hypothetical protein
MRFCPYWKEKKKKVRSIDSSTQMVQKSMELVRIKR